MKEGFITKVNAGWYEVYDGTSILACRARGKFRIQDQSPLVGDYVTFDPDQAYLQTIHPRKNRFIRPPIANVDQVVVIASLVHPTVSLGLINRFLVLCAVAGMKPLLAISKIDLASMPSSVERRLLESLRDLDYELLFYSAKTLEGIEAIRCRLQGKKTVFTGQSGVGKSTLINVLIPGFKQQETGEISKALGRGKHVTRIVEFLRFDENSWLADTPGFSQIEFDLTPTELAALYPGFSSLSSKCQFRNCMHDNEPGCAVKAAVEQGTLLADQYEIYQSLLTEVRARKERF
jgi:ribosome biogenesis GTPase